MQADAMTAPLVTAAATGVHVAGPARPHELDPFFKKSDGVLKTYEIDYDSLAAFDKEVCVSSIVGMACIPPGCCITAPIAACYYSLFHKRELRGSNTNP